MLEVAGSVVGDAVGLGTEGVLPPPPPPHAQANAHNTKIQAGR
jgi:hypothetical protein